MKATPTKIQVFVSPELHIRFRITTAKHGISGQKALEPYILKCVEELEATEPEFASTPSAKAIA